MSDYGLIPNYTDVDFQTLVTRLKKLLSKTETFKDYDFEGSNMTLIMELLSYIGDLNIFYTNRLAQNIHTETADIYEVVHSLVRQQGYVPVGYSSSVVKLTVKVRRRSEDESINYFDEGDELFIPKWFKVNTGLKDPDENIIFYCMTEDFYFKVTPDNIVYSAWDEELEKAYDYVEFDIYMNQGIPLQSPLVYTGEDIVSNQIVMSFDKWDMGVYPYEESSAVLVTVGESEEPWDRVSDFYDGISGLSSVDNVYLFSYDKYKRSVLTFSTTRRVPEPDDVIKIYLIKTLGISGAISHSEFGGDNKPKFDTILGVSDVPFLSNITMSPPLTVADNRYTVVNTKPSVGGSIPEDIDELKIGGMAYSHSQLRNVTKTDYKGNLEARGDITVANAWGEQEEHPEVLDAMYYNKAYLSFIPTEWDTEVYNNIRVVDKVVSNEFTGLENERSLVFPIRFNGTNVYHPVWEAQILEFLEPRKMLGIWEEFILPELVYFRIDFGLRVKRTYSWVSVKETIKNKLMFYFKNSNRKFGEKIDFAEIYNFLVDTRNTSVDDDFALIRGINSLVIRDILIYRDPVRVGLVDEPEACEWFGGTWSNGCSFVQNELGIYDDNILNYFPHFVDTGYFRDDKSSIDDVYNTIQPIQLGHNQFPQLAANFCVFANEG